MKSAIRIGALALLAAFLLPAVGVSAAQPAPDDPAQAPLVSNLSDDASLSPDYAAYAENATAPAGETSVSVDLNGASAAQGLTAAATDEGLHLQGTGSVRFGFDVPAAASFQLQLTCRIVGELDPEYSLLLDETLPFAEARALILPQYWTDDGVRFDADGNEFSSAARPDETFYDRFAADDTGVYSEPYAFSLTAGHHTLTLSFTDVDLTLSALTFLPVRQAPAYADLARTYAERGYQKATGAPLSLQGEDAVLKTDRSLPARSDTESPNVSPHDFVRSRVNYIGGGDWNSPGESLSWELDVAQDGLYALGLRFKQDQLINGYSYRRLTIDGALPFAEAANLRFFYKSGWQTALLGEGEEPYYFYLTAGRHLLTLSVTLGETAAFYGELKQLAAEIGDLYLNIVMITGESPDANRDYDLFNQIPGFNDFLSDYRDRLNALAEAAEALSGKRTGQYVGALKNMARVLSSMLKNPYLAQDYVSDYYTQYTNLSSWVYEMKSMPLAIDELRLGGETGNLKPEQAGFFRSLTFTLRRFLASFSGDYNSAGSVSAADVTLKIWVNWGLDQTRALAQQIEESFVPYAQETLGKKVGVKLQITAATLINGLLSGDQPDLALSMPRTDPLNYAMRGALCDLSTFSDCAAVLDRFQPGADLPYRYGNGLYALPDTQSFYLLYYRSDILESLGLSVPETWEDFLHATAVIQRNNMQAYLPVSALTNNAGLGACGIYASLLMQDGIPVYNADKTACLLDSSDAIATFTRWTEMFTQYKIPTTNTNQSFYTRFRVGLCPLGIDLYTQYTVLQTAAPEIKDRWGIALLPGTRGADGKINRTASGAGTGCGILEKSAHKEEAWAFLKWWTSADAQLAYNNALESVLGAVSRVATSNREAFARMAWNRADLPTLTAQFDLVREFEEVPGGYYVTRSADQAFWAVINHTVDNPKDAIVEWNTVANQEIARKVNEYKVGENG